MTTPPISRRALNRALLARQLLLERAELSAEDALEHLVGLQAQAPGTPYIALAMRLAGFDVEDLGKLIADHRAVRIALMRNTIHLVTATDARRLRSVLQPTMARSFGASRFAKQLTGLDLAAVAATGRLAVDEHPSTFAELGSLLSESWPDRDPASLAQVVRALVPLVQVPPRGIWGRRGQARHTSLDALIGPSPVAPASVADLVARYLGSFGPASVADLQTWSGLTRLRPVVDRMAPELMVFHDETGTELFDLPEAPRPDPDTPAPVRLVAEYDNILLSHADRRRIISDEQRTAMVSANGVVPGTVLIDGFVGAFWKMTRDRRRATITVTPLRRLSKRHLAAVGAEGRRLLSVTDTNVPSHDVVVTST